MKNVAFENNSVVISVVKKICKGSVLLCLLCSTVWILCLKNSIANKKIYLFCVILALVSSFFDCEITELYKDFLVSKTKKKLLVLPAVLLSVMVTVANWNLYRGLDESINAFYFVTVLISGIYIFYRAIQGLYALYNAGFLQMPS